VRSDRDLSIIIFYKRDAKRDLFERQQYNSQMVRLKRSSHNPIIEASDDVGAIVNSPSVIKIPSWIEDPLGAYYMYFSHKHGSYIRMAYADHPEGPWEIYSPGVLDIEETPFVGHIASPDVHVDHSEETIRMYYHGESSLRDLVFGPIKHRKYRRESYDYRYRSIPHRVLYQAGRTGYKQIQNGGRDGITPPSEQPTQSDDPTNNKFNLMKLLTRRPIKPPTVQETRHAKSSTGLSFTAQDSIIGPSWLAVFHYNERWYGIGSRDGYLFSSDTPTDPFDRKQKLLKTGRHFGVHCDEDKLEVYYSKSNDQPERILRTNIILSTKSSNWKLGDTIEVLAPEMKYEGSNISLEVTQQRSYSERRQIVRDPSIFVDRESKYMFYALAGETGIGVVKLLE